MNYRMIARILGFVLLLEAALLLLPMTAGLCYGEKVGNFLVTVALTAAAGGLLTCLRPKSRELYARDGLTAVGLAWILLSLFGALPFVLSGEIPNYADALFETVSGFTTTGASVVTDVEAMSKGCLFWRSFTHWIGGMGVLVFVMAVLPMNGAHSMHIMRAEIPGPSVGKLVPRVKKTARILYLIYAVLTAAETLLLMLGGMSFFEALLHAFGTAGTGGFSTRNASIGAYNSVYIEMVIAVFLVLFAMNFNLFYLLLIGKLREALRSDELHWYLGIILFSVLTVAGSIARSYGSFATGLRHAFFSVMSIVSTAGFGTEDFTLWPAYAQGLIVLLMFIGGCSGSTAGGLKLSRVILLIKASMANAMQIFRPRTVNRVEMDGKSADRSTIGAVYGYTSLYLVFLLACMLLISPDGFDFTTNFTAALSCISNVGPGLSMVGPAHNYAAFSGFSKIVMILTMLIGRLELYPILILAFPSILRDRKIRKRIKNS